LRRAAGHRVGDRRRGQGLDAAGAAGHHPGRGARARRRRAGGGGGAGGAGARTRRRAWPRDGAGAAGEGTAGRRRARRGGGAAEPAEGEEPEVLARGLGAAPGRATGRVRLVRDLQDAAALEEGEVLVTRMTAPGWVPLMRRAAAVVTDSGGMTCHAAIVSREL